MCWGIRTATTAAAAFICAFFLSCYKLTDGGSERLDDKCRPNLIESRLSRDSYLIPFFVTRLTGREKRVGGFDLIWNDGPVYMDDTSGADCIPNPSYPTNTFLGKIL